MKKLVEYFTPESSFWTWTFVIAVAIGTLFHFLTISYSPVPWLDEVQIIEIAQGGVGTKNTDWGMCVPAISAYAKRSWAVYYLGGLLNEIACQLFNIYGPRSMSLFGLVLTSVLLFTYIRRRGCEKVVATALSLCLFAYPCITQSVRGARVDIWPMACLFVALHCLYGLDINYRKKIYVRCFLAGMLAVTGCFFWAVGCFLLPLYAWGFFENFRKPISAFRDWITPAIAVILGLSVATAIWLIPFYSDLWTTIEMAQWISASNSNVNSLENIREAWKGFLYATLTFPFMFAIGFACLLLARKNFWMKFGFLAMFAVCVFIAARIYVFRLVYFAAYAFLGVICFLQNLVNYKKLRIGINIVLVVIAFGAYCRSVLVRDGVEYLARNGRSHEQLRALMQYSVGTGKRIYLCTFEPYYVGRELNWKMYNCPLQGGLNDLQVSWDKIDAIIYAANDDHVPIDDFKARGFINRTELNMPDPNYSAFENRVLDLAHKKKKSGPLCYAYT